MSITKLMFKWEEKFYFMSILQWGGILLVIFWIIGKLTGLIHSPVWVQMLPYIGGIIPLLILCTKIGEVLGAVKSNSRDIRSIKKILRSHDQSFSHIDTQLSRIDLKIEGIDHRFDILESRVGALETRF